MSITHSLRFGAVRKSSLRLALTVAASLVLAGAAHAANPGDEVPFREGEPMPPAPAGMSWCLVQKPAVYETASETVVVRPKANFQVPVAGEYSDRTETVRTAPAYRTGEVVPARIEAKTVSYIEQAEYEAIEVVPAQFEDTLEEVEVCPSYERIAIVPAEFRSSSRRIMTEPARKSFLRDKCDNGLLCWTVCETPAQYIDVPTRELVADAREERSVVPARKEKVMVRKMVKPAEVRRRTIPAQRGSYQAAVVAEQARVEWRTIPAERRDVTVKVETKAPSFVSQAIPEKTETITRRVLSQPERLVWRLQTAGAYSAPVSACSVASPCSVARHVPQGTPHVCRW